MEARGRDIFSPHIDTPFLHSDWPKYSATSTTAKTIAGIAIDNSAVVTWQEPEGLSCTLITSASEEVETLLNALGGWF